jgi:hypothetical protein
MTATINESAILDLLGGPMELRPFRFPVAEHGPVMLLSLELRLSCGSVDRNSASGYEVLPDPARWRTLRDVEAKDIAWAVRRTMRVYPDWRLPGTDAQDLHARVDSYYANAMKGR